MYDFDQAVNRKGTLSVKWNEDAIASIAGNRNAEPFWVADMDFRVAPEIQQEMVKAAESGTYGYPHFDGNRETFCAWAQRRHGWTVPQEEVVICQGMLTSIAMMVETLTQPGDGVIVPMPAYQPFIRIVKNLERTLVGWPLTYDSPTHRFSLDWEALDLLCQNAKMIIFCNPQNPSGVDFPEADLQRLCEIAQKHHTMIICDEIHADLAFGHHVPLLEVADNYDVRAVTCMAPSKTFNIAGEHFSVVVTHDEMIRKTLRRRMSQLFSGETSFFSTTAAIAAYRSGYPWLMELIPYLEGNCDTIESYFRQHLPSLTFIRPQASFIGFIDCAPILPMVEQDAMANPDLYDPEKSPAGGLLSRFFGQRASVAVNDGTWFGGNSYRQFVRFNYGVRRENIIGALKRMERAVKALG